MVAGAHEPDFRTFSLPGLDFDCLAFEEILADAFRVKGARLDPVDRCSCPSYIRARRGGPDWR